MKDITERIEDDYDDGLDKVRERINAGEKPYFGGPELLLLDLDDKNLSPVLERLKILQNDGTVVNSLTVESPSGRGYHVYVHLSREFYLASRLFLQEFLLSDPVRNYLSWRSIERGWIHEDVPDIHKNVVFLLEKPQNFKVIEDFYQSVAAYKDWPGIGIKTILTEGN